MQDLRFWTYIITNAYKGTLYAGHTDSIGQRMEQHKRGVFEGFSKRYGLAHLVWSQAFGTRDEAFKKERQIKEWKRSWKIALIEADNPMWIDIYTSPAWPVPNKARFPDLYASCLQHRLDPGLRRDERRFVDE